MGLDLQFLVASQSRESIEEVALDARTGHGNHPSSHDAIQRRGVRQRSCGRERLTLTSAPSSVLQTLHGDAD